MAAIDRFKKWVKDEGGKKYFEDKINDPVWIGRFGSVGNPRSKQLCRAWIYTQYTNICSWLEDNNPRYYAWKRFAGGWLRRNLDKRANEAAKALNPGLMTAQQEEDYYKKPREGQTGFTSIKDILSGKAQKENS